MTGLLLLFVAAVWLALVTLMTYAVAQQIRNAFFRSLVALILFGVLLPLPLADELIGKQQFESLCRKYAAVKIDEQHAMNRRVLATLRKVDQYADGTAIPIRIDPYVYSDAETNQVLVSFHTLHAQGGWLIRSLGISETNAPLLFRSGCAPEDRYAFKKKFNITVIN